MPCGPCGASERPRSGALWPDRRRLQPALQPRQALPARPLPDVVVPGALDRHEAEALRDAGAPVRAREYPSGIARAGDRYGQVLRAAHQQERRVGEACGVANRLPLAQPPVVGGVEVERLTVHAEAREMEEAVRVSRSALCGPA